MIDDIQKQVKDAMPVYKDWPKPGINYLNTVDICRNPVAFRNSIEYFYTVAATRDADHVFAADARGFIWGSPVAYRLGIPLHVIRKKNKMPGDLLSEDYELEYGTDTLQLRNVPIQSHNVILVDDVLATGGTAIAMCNLVHKLGVNYQSMAFVSLINISFLPGKNRLREMGVSVYSLIDVNE